MNKKEKLDQPSRKQSVQKMKQKLMEQNERIKRKA